MKNGNPQWRTFWLAALAIFLAWLIWRLSAIIFPFFLAGLVAYLLNPFVDRLERRGWPRVYAILLLIVVMVAIGVVIGLTLVPRLWTEVSGLLEQYAPLAEKAQTSYQEWLHRLPEALPGLKARGELTAQVSAKLVEALKWVLTKIPAFLGRFLQGVASFATLMLVTIILSYWILKEYHSLGRRLLALVPERYAASAVSLSGQINKIVSAYLLGLLLLCATAAAAAIIVLLIFGVQYGYLLGLLVGVGYAIPYFGVPIAAIVTIIAAAVTGHSWPALLGIAACLVGLNLVLDYGISPRIIGKRVGLHPLTVIFALLAAGEIFGFIGILIALPLAAAIKACLATFFPEFFSPAPASAQKG